MKSIRIGLLLASLLAAGLVLFTAGTRLPNGHAHAVITTIPEHDHNGLDEAGHAGGLDAYGCHVGPAGYHCHR